MASRRLKTLGVVYPIKAREESRSHELESALSLLFLHFSLPPIATLFEIRLCLFVLFLSDPHEDIKREARGRGIRMNF